MSQINESAIVTPGVYVTEIDSFPPSVAQVATAIPVFIGYTYMATDPNGKNVMNKPVHISSLTEYVRYFGQGPQLTANVALNADNSVNSVSFASVITPPAPAAPIPIPLSFQMFNAIQLFYNHGGGDCYIFSAGTYSPSGTIAAAGVISIKDFLPTDGSPTCFDVIQKNDVITLIVIPDAVLFGQNEFNNLMVQSLDQCGKLQDRFTIMDVWNGYLDRTYDDNTDVITNFRTGVGTNNLNYGAAYYPWLNTSLPLAVPFSYLNQNINFNLANTATPPVFAPATLDAIVPGNAYVPQILNATTDENNLIPILVDSNSRPIPGLPMPGIQTAADLTTFVGSVSDYLTKFLTLPDPTSASAYAITDDTPAMQNGLTVKNIYSKYITPSAMEDTPSIATITCNAGSIFTIGDKIIVTVDVPQQDTPPLVITLCTHEVTNATLVADNDGTGVPIAAALVDAFNTTGFSALLTGATPNNSFTIKAPTTGGASLNGINSVKIKFTTAVVTDTFNYTISDFSGGSTVSALTQLEEYMVLLKSINNYPGGALTTISPFTNYTNLPVNADEIPNPYGTATGPGAVAVVLPLATTLFKGVTSMIGNFLKDISNLINGLEQQLMATSATYKNIVSAANVSLLVPPSGAIAGIYAYVDSTRGVWKAPANVSLTTVISPAVTIDDDMQGDLNIDPNTGKSINAIRAFTGKGNLVWGARTLDGNDNNWRYVPVRRFFIMVEESVKLAAFQFVFEPNVSFTWLRLQAMIQNYLTGLWRLGAITGSKPEQGFYVSVGLGQTMTQDDILNGKLIVEIGIAPVRPAEFIILRFTQTQQQS